VPAMRGISDSIYAADTAFSDWLYRAVTGQVPADQVQAISSDTYNGIIRAGGTPQQAQAGAVQTSAVAQQPGGTNLLLWLGIAVGAIILIKTL